MEVEFASRAASVAARMGSVDRGAVETTTCRWDATVDRFVMTGAGNGIGRAETRFSTLGLPPAVATGFAPIEAWARSAAGAFKSESSTESREAVVTIGAAGAGWASLTSVGIGNWNLGVRFGAVSEGMSLSSCSGRYLTTAAPLAVRMLSSRVAARASLIFEPTIASKMSDIDSSTGGAIDAAVTEALAASVWAWTVATVPRLIETVLRIVSASMRLTAATGMSTPRAASFLRSVSRARCRRTPSVADFTFSCSAISSRESPPK
jgi:hypothetical protein